jgi:hypothetical protein
MAVEGAGQWHVSDGEDADEDVQKVMTGSLKLLVDPQSNHELAATPHWEAPE